MAQPDFNILAPIEYRDGNGRKATRWVRFGSVWRNRDGDGYSGTIGFFPAGARNRVVLMPPKADTPGDTASHAAAEAGAL
jgi:hypothetical protein